MEGLNTITISRIADGWLLALPYNYTADMMQDQATAVLNAVHGDPVLDQLKKIEKQSSDKFPIMKEERLLFFKTLEELCLTLMSKINDENKY